MLQMMQSSIDLDEHNIENATDRIRYFMYLGTEEMMTTLLNVLGVDLIGRERFLPPGSQIRFDLYKHWYA